MLPNFVNNFRTFKALVMRDVHLLLASWSSNIIDSTIIVVFWYMTYAWLLPSMGLDKALITPIFFGIIMMVFINISFDRAMIDGLDMETTRFIDYQLTLPLPTNWLLAKYATGYFLDLLCSSLPVIIIGRLLFGSLLHLDNGSIPLFFVFYFCTLVLMSLMMLCLIAAKSFWWMRDNAWPRILLPLSLFGAFYYPWRAVYQTDSVIGTLYLFNPFVYFVEGLRSAATGSAEYIPLYWCFAVVITLCVVVAISLKIIFNKRIDPLV